MGSSKAPKTPDYTSAAIQQGKNDKEVAEYLTQQNRVNQVDPYGQTTWDTAPVTHEQRAAEYQKILGQYNDAIKAGNKNTEASDLWAKLAAGGDYGLTGTPRQTTTLSPAQQALLEQQQGIQGQQNTRISELIKNYETPELKGANQNDIQNLLYGQITKQYGDRFAKEEASQRAQLANQGFQMGSEGYNTTLNDFTRDKNSAYEDAATQAALASYDQTNKERSLNLNDYNSQMGYLTQLLGGVQGPTNPQYQPYAQASQFQSPDLLGAMQGQYQGDLNRTNAANAGKSSTLGAVGTVATAAAIAY